jgi:hypothetical protein
MGQYWVAVNLDKREFIHPHKLACGLKLWEQLAANPSTGTALIILCAAEREARGGGDFDLVENWHGPERVFPKHSGSPGPMPPEYQEIAHRTIGRWAGDRIALVGDYAKDSDLPAEFHASVIYDLCRDGGGKDADGQTVEDEDELKKGKAYTDITDDVCAVIEHELTGKFKGDGWRDFVGHG